MNTRGKGVRNMKLLEDHFIASGRWSKEFSYKAPHGRFLKDIYNMFDGVSIDIVSKKVIFWQLKSHKSDYYSAKKDILRFMEECIGHWNDNVYAILYIIEKNENGKFVRSYESTSDGNTITGFERIEPLKEVK